MVNWHAYLAKGGKVFAGSLLLYFLSALCLNSQGDVFAANGGSFVFSLMKVVSYGAQWLMAFGFVMAAIGLWESRKIVNKQVAINFKQGGGRADIQEEEFWAWLKEDESYKYLTKKEQVAKFLKSRKKADE